MDLQFNTNMKIIPFFVKNEEHKRRTSKRHMTLCYYRSSSTAISPRGFARTANGIIVNMMTKKICQ